jgi:hypothetical protein
MIEPKCCMLAASGLFLPGEVRRLREFSPRVAFADEFGLPASHVWADMADPITGRVSQAAIDGEEVALAQAAIDRLLALGAIEEVSAS